MKFLHTSDLHIGKKLFELSMLEEQKHVLSQICEIAQTEEVDAVVIAGDVYDRAIPSAEAVMVLDEFLTRLIGMQIPVIMISGNHDCGERVGFADRILEGQGLHIAGTYEGTVKEVVIPDEWGAVHFVCLPFVKPGQVGASNSAEAVEKILSATPMMYARGHRYVLVTHFFVTGEGGEEPQLSDSESVIHVGGLDNVPVSLFQAFSYVAMGHIHKAQRIGTNAWYSGTPLKYSFSEANQEKGVFLVNIDEHGQVQLDKKVLTPLHEIRIIKGSLEQIMNQEPETEQAPDAKRAREDYIQVILTDTEELMDPMGTLRSVYPNVLQILLEKNEIIRETEYESRLTGSRKEIEELFADFYELVKGEALDEVRQQYVTEAAKAARAMVEKGGDKEE